MKFLPQFMTVILMNEAASLPVLRELVVENVQVADKKSSSLETAMFDVVADESHRGTGVDTTSETAAIVDVEELGLESVGSDDGDSFIGVQF